MGELKREAMVVLTAGQLQDLVESAVRTALGNANAVAEYLTLAEAAKLMKASTRSVRNWVKLKGLPAMRAGSDYRFRHDSVIAWMESQPSKRPRLKRVK